MADLYALNRVHAEGGEGQCAALQLFTHVRNSTNAITHRMLVIVVTILLSPNSPADSVSV